jgi:hypothetical protein
VSWITMLIENHAALMMALRAGSAGPFFVPSC